jgi:hypothetical protein
VIGPGPSGFPRRLSLWAFRCISHVSSARGLIGWHHMPWYSNLLRRSYSDISAANTTKWISIGLLGLPLYGVLQEGKAVLP